MKFTPFSGQKTILAGVFTASTAIILGVTLGVTLVVSAPAHAKVTRIVIDETLPMPTAAGSPANAIAYEQVAGRAFGELDPKSPNNAIIQDIELAKDADGKVRYVASFVIYKPVDMGKSSGMMWHDVPNRGRVYPFAPQELAAGDVMLASAWQGDNSGATTVRPKASVAGMQFFSSTCGQESERHASDG